MAKLVSKTYGEALFQLAMEEKQLELLEKEAKYVLSIFRSNQELFKVLNHPKISREEKISMMERVFKGTVSDDIVGFLVIIVRKGRNNELEEILEYFLAEVKEHKNIGVAFVTSAVILSDGQKKQIEDRLLEVTNYIRFEMHFKVDESLIGGLVIRIGDRVVDSSIRTKLNTMSNELKKIQLS